MIVGLIEIIGIKDFCVTGKSDFWRIGFWCFLSRNKSESQ